MLKESRPCLRRAAKDDGNRMKLQKKAKLSSMQIIALGFFIMIALGTALLMLPVSSRASGGASFLDVIGRAHV